MQMRETVRSLRAYFVVTGLVVLLHAAVALRATGIDPVTVIVEAIVVGFGLAFLYEGIFLPQLLRNSPGRIVGLLYASAALSGLAFVVSLLGGFSPSGLLVLVLTLVVLWYLLKSVRRLAGEAQTPPPAPASPANP